MSWNYRIIVKTQLNPIKGVKPRQVRSFDVHEVYYSKKGKPNACTQDPIIGGFESVRELRSSLAMMLRDSFVHPTVLKIKKKGIVEEITRRIK